MTRRKTHCTDCKIEAHKILVHLMSLMLLMLLSLYLCYFTPVYILRFEMKTEIYASWFKYKSLKNLSGHCLLKEMMLHMVSEYCLSIDGNRGGIKQLLLSIHSTLIK